MVKNVQKIDSDETLGNRIKICAKRVGSQKALADAVDISDRVLYDYIHDKTSPPSKKMTDIAQAAGVDTNWLLTGEGSPDIMSNVVDAEINIGRRRISVHGFAESSQQGWYEKFETKETVGVDTNDPDAFAVIAIGESMKPGGIKNNAICVVSPAAQVEVGDNVYVQRKDNTVTIKELVAIDDQWVTLRGWQDPDANGNQAEFTDKTNMSFITQIAPVVWVKTKENC